MTRLRPCERREFIKKQKSMGFEGLYYGTRHEFMVIDNYRLSIQSNIEYSVPQLRMMLKEVESIMGRPINTGEWNKLK